MGLVMVAVITHHPVVMPLAAEGVWHENIFTDIIALLGKMGHKLV